MRSSKLQKPQKPLSSKTIPPPNQAIKYSYYNYTNLANQQYLFHALKLLGVTQAQYMKQTKLSMSDEVFGKSQSASTTKQFFFIVVTCLRFLCNQEEFSTIKMWYPPRTVNEQLQFKKALFGLFAKLQMKNKVPANVLISKNFLMGQTPSSKVVQFLRVLSELALRSDYLDKYSKKQRLIEICLKQTQNPQKQPNNINRSYIYPFVPGQTAPNLPLQQIQVQSLKKIYKIHIEMYRKKIISLANKYEKEQPISCQQLMASLVEEKQLAETLTKKIPKSVLSENRAFDRRKIIDKSRYVWNKLRNVSCSFVDRNETQSILKLEGEIDKILLKWQTPSGINKMLDVCNMTEKLNTLKEQCSKKMQQFRQFRERVDKQLKKYQR